MQCPMVLLKKPPERGWHHCRLDVNHEGEHEPFRSQSGYWRGKDVEGVGWMLSQDAETKDREYAKAGAYVK